MQQHVWSLTSLQMHGIESLDTYGLAPLRQETQFGYLQIHTDGALTSAWKPSNVRTFWHVLPRHQVAILTSSPYAKVTYDNLSHAPIPKDARHILHLTTRWLHRVHAHTPVVKWYDAQRTESLQQMQGVTYSRVMGILYSAPRNYAADYELRLHCCRSTEQECISVRISRQYDQVIVQQHTYTLHSHQQATTTVSISKAQSMTSVPCVRWAVHQALAMHAMADALRAQVRPRAQYTASPVSPLDQLRRAELHARERTWYERSNAPWPF